MEFKDYYQTLGVPRSATEDDIKKAYRKLARRFHPDVSSEDDAETRFKEIGEAYEVLRDKEKRSAYDRFGSDWKAGQEFRPPPGWDPNAQFGGRGFSGEGFSDFFESLFGQGRSQGPGHGRGRPGGFGDGRQRPMRGEDRNAQITISLEDAYAGATRAISMQTPGPRSRRTGAGTRKLNVKIPAGTTEGQRIRLAGQGGAGRGGAGDLYLEISFESHPIYKVDGRDITLDLPVTPWEAALGARVAVPTLGGNVDLTIPAGSQSGKRLRLRGRGLPARSASGVAGDQYVVLKIVTPAPTSEEQRAFYEQMAAAMPMDPRTHLGSKGRRG